MKEGPVLVEDETFVELMFPEHAASALEVNESEVVQAVVLVLDERETTLFSGERPAIWVWVGVVDAGDSGHEDLVVGGEDTFNLILLIGVHRRLEGHRAM